MVTERLLTSAEVARQLGVHVGTLQRWTREGLAKPDRVTLGGHRRWSEASVERIRRRLLPAQVTRASA